MATLMEGAPVLGQEYGSLLAPMQRLKAELEQELAQAS